MTVGRRRRDGLVGRVRSSSDPATIRPPTRVGGRARAPGVRSAGETDPPASAHVRVRRADRARRARERARGRCQERRSARAADDGVVRRAGGRARRAAASRSPPVPLRRPRDGLAGGCWTLVRRRAAGRVHDRRHGRRHGRCVPARQPTRRRSGANRLGRRPQQRGDHRLQQPRSRRRRVRLHPGPVRDRLARRLRPARACGAGRGGGRASEPGRAGARVGGAHRRRRGARADRARAPRHRRPRRQRDGAPGRRRPAQASRHARRRRGGAPRRRADRPCRARPRCAASSARCAATATTSSSRPGRASTASTRCWRRSAAPAFPSSCTSTASPSGSRRRSTSRPIASSKKA